VPTTYSIFTYDHDEKGNMYRLVGQETAASPSAALRAHFNEHDNENGDEFVIVPTSNIHRRTAQIETRRQLTITEDT
jgi:hypothetical protein